MRKYVIFILFLLTTVSPGFSQSAPAVDENIPYLMTFGGNALTSWGDDDFIQIFICVIPSSQTDPVYIRVYDPDTGEKLMNSREILILLLTFQSMQERVAGQTLQHRVFIPGGISRADIYCHQNLSGLI